MTDNKELIAELRKEARSTYGGSVRHRNTMSIRGLLLEAADALEAAESEWLPIETAPEKARVLVTGGDTPNSVCIAINDPDRYTPYHESHHRLPRIQGWYSDTTRGSGKIWPAPTHWRPLPAPPKKED